MIGPIVYVRYRDHVLFRDVDPGAQSRPFVRETVGWLDHENGESVRLIWERLAEAGRGEERQRATGLVILKSCILELRRGV